MPKNTFSLAADTTRIPQHSFYDLRNAVQSTGNIWFVDSGCLNAASATGRSPDYAVATIDAAINLCTANNGDIIVVMEGHAESVIAANGIALDVLGVTIIGLGRGRSRPVITFTTALGASFDISAASNHVENLVFVCNFDDQTAMVNVTAADVTIRNCEFQMSDATYDAEIGVKVSDAGDRVCIEDCKFHGTGNTAVVAGAISFGAADNSVIRRNIITGYFGTTGCILNAAAAVNVVISNNVLLNRSADANNLLINLHASTVAFIDQNRGGMIDSTGPTPVVAAASFVGQNYFSTAAGVSASTLM
jgi:hypothetical protein